MRYSIKALAVSGTYIALLSFTAIAAVLALLTPTSLAASEDFTSSPFCPSL